MKGILSLLILSLAVSLDSFGVGITYGLRKIKIPILSILIISIASVLMILVSMQIGIWLSLILSPAAGQLLGSIILIAIGFWAIFQVMFSSHEADEQANLNISNVNKQIIFIEIKKLGLVIQILKTPVKADIDRSGKISAIEAVFLGLALSLDAFGAGFGAALVGFKPLITGITIASMSAFFIIIGLQLGFFFSKVKWLQKLTVVPGVILILLGLIKFF